jgi:hypothetical protein
MFRRLHRYTRCFRVLDHCWLWGLRSPVDTEGAGLCKTSSDNVEAGDVMIASFGLLFFFRDNCLLVVFLELF